MVLAGISLGGRTDLYVFPRGGVTAVWYLNEVLEPIVRQYAGAIGDTFMLMQDNARAHTARVAMSLLDDECITVMNWAARSTDLNPIEHGWDMLSRRIRRRQHPPDNLQTLIDAIVQEWQAISQNDIRRIIRSMSRRCQECANARGGHTSYWWKHLSTLIWQCKDFCKPINPIHGGVDAHLHLQALSSPRRSLNYDLLCSLHNSLRAYSSIKV